MSSANNSKMIVMSSIVKPELISSNKNNSKSSIGVYAYAYIAENDKNQKALEIIT